MENRLQLNADFIRGYLTHLQLPPQTFEVDGPLGLTLGVTLELTRLQFDQGAILLPLEIARFPNPHLRLHRFQIEEPYLWFEVDKVHLGPLKLPVSRLVRHLLRLVLPAEGTFINEGNRFGLDIQKLVADRHHLRITEVEISDGLLLHFALPPADKAPPTLAGG